MSQPCVVVLDGSASQQQTYEREFRTRWGGAVKLMGNNSGIMTYRLPEPFEHALGSVRETVTKHGLSVPLEFDVSQRINRELGIALSPCRVLYVDNPLLLLHAITLDGSAAVWLPLRVVVAGRGPQTLVHVLESAGAPDQWLAADSPIGKLRGRLSRALQAVAMREDCSRMHDTVID